MNVHDVLSSPASMRLALALLHFLWQGLLVALLAAAGAKALGRHSARIRYGVYVAALIAMVLAVAATYAVVHPAAAPRSSPTATAAAAASAEAPAATFTTGERVAPASLEVAASGASPEAPAAAGPIGWPNAAPIAVGAYLVGVLIMTGRLLVGLQGGGRLRRRSRPVDDSAILAALGRQARALGLAFTPALAYCSRVLVPTVVGVLRPIILLPFSFATGLAAEQVEALLAHELAHIRRLDPLVNVVQRVIEALLFFHPAVWFISQRMRVEREHCCDDLVVGVSASASTYASSLLEAARRGLQGRAVARLAPQGVGLADRPSRLRARIVRLLGQQAHERMRLRWTWLMGLVLAVSVGLAATVSLGGGPAGEDQGTAAGDTSGADTGQPVNGDTTGPKATSPAGGADAVLEILREVGDSDASLQVEIDLQLGRVDRTALGEILKAVAPDSGDPKVQPLILSVEQRKALDAALAELPEDEFQWLSAPRLVTLNRTKAAIDIIGDQDDEGNPVEGVRFSCAPVVSADRTSIVLVLFSKTVKGQPAGSLRFGSDAFQLLGTDEGGLMAAYRIPNGGTLVLTGTDVHAPASSTGMTPGSSSAMQPHVQLALVRARTVNEDLRGPAEDEAAARDSGETTLTAANLDEFVTEVFRLSPGADRTVPDGEGDGEMTQIEDMIRHGGVVTWPEGSSIVYDEPTKTLTVTNTRLNMVAVREMIRVWNALQGGTGEGGEARGSAEAVSSVEDEIGDRISTEVRNALGGDAAADPGADEASEARERIEEKLDTVIPEVDFKDADLEELLHYLAEAAGVKIVIDPKATKQLEDAAVSSTITIKLKNVPLRHVLKYALRYKGLEYVVEDDAIIIVPVGEAPAEEMKTEVFHLLVSGVRTVVPPNGERREETIDEWLRRAQGVTWPEGSTVAYDKLTEALTVKNAPENMAPIYTKIRAWNRGSAETDPPQSRVIIRTTGSVGSEPAENAAGEKITTARFNLQGSGTRTVSDAGGESRIETIDEWLGKAEGVTWPQGSRVVYDSRIEMLTVSNTAENQAVIRELVTDWEAQEGDGAADAASGDSGEGVDEKEAD